MPRGAMGRCSAAVCGEVVIGDSEAIACCSWLGGLGWLVRLGWHTDLSLARDFLL